MRVDQHCGEGFSLKLHSHTRIFLRKSLRKEGFPFILLRYVNKLRNM